MTYAVGLGTYIKSSTTAIAWWIFDMGIKGLTANLLFYTSY
jgi:hypothetical protein